MQNVLQNIQKHADMLKLFKIKKMRSFVEIKEIYWYIK